VGIEAAHVFALHGSWEVLQAGFAAADMPGTQDKFYDFFQIVQDKLVKMLAEVCSMQLYCLRLGRLIEEGGLTDTIAAIAKMNNTRRAREVVATARDLLGADGIGMLTPEPTGGIVWNANRGAITLRVTARGKTAHVGRQHDGVNAFEGMLTVAQALVELKSLEDEGDRILRDALAALFRGEGIDPPIVIRWKDIYEALERGLDACETAANVIANIAVKNA